MRAALPRIREASSFAVRASSQTLRAASAAIDSPWSFEGPSGLSYTSPLSQVHWRRVVLDEGHSVKNAGAECSQQAGRLLGRCRWLMSGTPFGTSLMDARGQTKFLAAAGLAGSFLFTELQRFMQSQGRCKDLAAASSQAAGRCPFSLVLDSSASVLLMIMAFAYISLASSLYFAYNSEPISNL